MLIVGTGDWTGKNIGDMALTFFLRKSTQEQSAWSQLCVAFLGLVSALKLVGLAWSFFFLSRASEKTV